MVQPVVKLNKEPAEANAPNWNRKKHCHSFQKFYQAAYLTIGNTN